MDLGNGDATLGREILMKLDDDKRNVRFWHKADIEELPANVRFRGQSGHCPSGRFPVDVA
jgi:hypothetical protein